MGGELNGILILKSFGLMVDTPAAPTELEIVTFGKGTLMLKLLGLVVETPTALAAVLLTAMCGKGTLIWKLLALVVLIPTAEAAVLLTTILGAEAAGTLKLKLFGLMVDTPAAPTVLETVTFGNGTLILKLLGLVVETPTALAAVLLTAM